MQKRKFLFISSASIIATGGLVLSIIANAAPKHLEASADTYSLQLNSSNALTGVSVIGDGTYTVKTVAGNDIMLDYTNAQSVENKHISLNDGALFLHDGFLIKGFSEVSATFTGTLKLKAAVDEGYWLKDVTLVAGDNILSENEAYNYFYLYGTGVVENLTFSYSCIETPTQNPAAPTITVNDSYTGYAEEGIDIGASAKSYHGEDLAVNYTVLSGGEASIVDGVFTAETSGTYSVKVSATDPIKDTLVSEKTISVNAYRRLIKQGTAVGDWGTIDELKPDDEQTVTLTNNGMAYLHLNMTESNYYYVEFQVTNQSWGGWVGFAHGHGDYVYSNEMLKTVLVPSTNGVGRGYPNGNMWSDGNTEWHEYLDDSNYQFNGNYIKFGVARVGEYFYTFINDQYEGATQADGVSNVATKAAFWANAYSAGNEDLVLSKIVFLKDEISTRNKVAALLDGKMMKPYVANTAYWSHNPSNFEFGKSNELGEYVKVLANNINQNSSIVSNWITYYGDFTFEFDYKFESTSLPSGDDAGRLQLELRPRSYGGDVIQFGCKYSKGQFMMDPTSDPSGGVYTTSIGDMTADLGGRWAGQYNWATGSNWGGVTYDDSQGTHYKIVRTFDGNGVMTIKATFNSIASPSMTKTRTFTIANPTDNSMRVTITNRNVKGVISNITYTI